MKTIFRILLLCMLFLVVPAAAAQNETLRLEDGRTALTVIPPEGWVSTEAEFSPTFPALALAPDESMLKPDILRGSEPPVLEAGQTMLIVTLLDNRSIPNTDRTVTLAEAVQALSENFEQSFGETNVQDDLTISGQGAALVSADTPGFSLGYLLIDAGIPATEGRRQFVVVLALTGPGELDEIRDTVLALAETIRIYDDDVLRFGDEPVVSGAAQGETVILEEDAVRMTLTLPSDWVQTDTRMFGSFPAAALAPTEAMLLPEVLQGSEPPVFKAGQVLLLATLTDADDLSAPERDSDLETVARNWADRFASPLGETNVDTSVSVGELPAAIVRVDAGSVEIGVLFVDVGTAPDARDSQFVLMMALTAPGELDSSLDVLLEVAASVRVYDLGIPRFTVEGDAAPAASTVTDGSHPLLELLSLLPPPSDEMLDNGAGRPLTVVHYLDLETLGTLDTDMLTPYADSIGELFQAEQIGMEDAIGISLSQIKRIVMYGLAPARMFLLAGEFDEVAMTEAMAELGFQIRAAENIVSFCNPEGCDQATRIDISARNPANPFGGNIGRREAIVLIKREGADDLLFASPNAELVANALAPFVGEGTNTGNPDMLAAASALLAAAPNTPLVAAYITPPEWIEGANTVADAELPPYSLAAVGSYQGDPSTTVALLYSEAGEAETAAASLPLRLDGEGNNGTYNEQFERREITIGNASTVALDDGQTAALLAFDSPE
ncbi:MAG: hypothetical protein JNJ61_29445, partial [Anaerolineae bacterium]|nr:hypothetical protein [Anaerolineae bacterium]